MDNLVGKKWGELDRETQELLLKNTNFIDGVTGNDIVNDGECIIDFSDILSVGGKVIDDEIIIDDNSILYNPCEGIKTKD